MAAGAGVSVVEDPICPKCPIHKVGKSLYCQPCGKEYDKIVAKEQDPNFECQACREDPSADPPHASHRTFTVSIFLDKVVVPYIDPRYNDAEKLLDEMKKLQKTVSQLLMGVEPYELIKFIETNLKENTKLWKDIQKSQVLMDEFHTYIDDLDELKGKREVLKFKDGLTHFGEYVDALNNIKYLMTADDDLIIRNYRPVFTTSLCESLPEHKFKSAKNTDLYDLMVIDGAFIQLDRHLLPPSKQALGKAGQSALSMSDETEETFDPEQVRELGKSVMMSSAMTASTEHGQEERKERASLATMEADAARMVTQISERRPELSEPLKIMNQQTKVKDIATRRKLDALQETNFKYEKMLLEMQNKMDLMQKAIEQMKAKI